MTRLLCGLFALILIARGLRPPEPKVRSGTPTPAAWVPLRARGVPRATLLYPRGPILSPAPCFIFATPGDQGIVEVEIRTSSGACLRRRTRERSLEWPPEMAALRDGDEASIALWSGAGFDEARFVFLPLRDERRAAASLSADELLDLGYPAEALRRLAREKRTRWKRLGEAAAACSLPLPAFWRAPWASGSL